jgi:hypothetical protein
MDEARWAEARTMIREIVHDNPQARRGELNGMAQDRVKATILGQGPLAEGEALEIDRVICQCFREVALAPTAAAAPQETRRATHTERNTGMADSFRARLSAAWESYQAGAGLPMADRLAGAKTAFRYAHEEGRGYRRESLYNDFVQESEAPRRAAENPTAAPPAQLTPRRIVSTPEDAQAYVRETFWHRTLNEGRAAREAEAQISAPVRAIKPPRQ